MVNFKWLRNLQKKFANRGTDGFSLIEMVTIIPVVALTSGFIVLLIAQGITISAESNAISNAGVAVNSRVNEINSAVNCYDLNQKAAGEKIYEQSTGKKSLVTTTNFNKASCVSGSNVQIKVSSHLEGNDRVLYTEDIQVFISE